MPLGDVPAGSFLFQTMSLVTEFYQLAVNRFGELGYRQYEISNFALPERQSRHNLKYWTNQPFIGFGCGAYSYFADQTLGQ